MTFIMLLLLTFLVVCALTVTFTKDLLNSVVIYMGYGVIMSIIWMLMESPDLAITEAAVGAGITSVLFFVTIKKMRQISLDEDKKKEGKK